MNTIHYLSPTHYINSPNSNLHVHEFYTSITLCFCFVFSAFYFTSSPGSRGSMDRGREENLEDIAGVCLMNYVVTC